METRLVQRLQVCAMSAVLMLVEHLSTGANRETDDDRGDVPGWVMITVMTAIVVIALLAVFREQVTTAVKNAFDSVSGAGKS